jgi:DNA-directed RNA polymerase I and III subunit RPAC1
MDLFAVKGRGADHAKFSPVATASYRLLPHIIIRQPIPRELQTKFKECFTKGVIEIENDANGEPQCVVKNPRKDTVTREVLRHKEFEGLVELTRIRDHFLCEYIFVYDAVVSAVMCTDLAWSQGLAACKVI